MEKKMDETHSCCGDPNDEDVIFYVVRDTSWGLAGVLEDKTPLGPRVLPGSRFDDTADRSRDFTR